MDNALYKETLVGGCLWISICVLSCRSRAEGNKGEYYRSTLLRSSHDACCPAESHVTDPGRNSFWFAIRGFGMGVLYSQM